MCDAVNTENTAAFEFYYKTTKKLHVGDDFTINFIRLSFIVILDYCKRASIKDLALNSFP